MILYTADEDAIAGTETKRNEFLLLLVVQKWPSTRRPKELWSLKLRQLPTAMRRGRFFLWRLLLIIGLEGQQESGDPQLAAVPKGTTTAVLLGKELHADLDW